MLAAASVTKDPAAAPAPAPPRRAPTIEAWTFSSEGGGRWHPVKYAEGAPVPQPRLTSAVAVVGDELWLVAGWDPSASSSPDGQQFLDDVWALDLRTYIWRRVEVAGEQMPRISRFALAALPDGRLLLHTHRCDDHVLVLDPLLGAGAGAAARTETTAATAPPPRPVLSKVAVNGPLSPPSRGLHSLTLAAPAASPTAAATTGTADGSRSAALYVYGGAAQSGPMYGDLWVLDTGAMTWRRLTPEGTAPQARCSHVAGACAGGGCGGGGGEAGRYLLVAGGSYYLQSGQLQPLDDAIVYDTQANRWVQPEVEGPRPSPRNAAVMAPLRRSGDSSGGGDRFVLHGGWRPFMETYDDTYIVTVTAAAEGGQ